MAGERDQRPLVAAAEAARAPGLRREGDRDVPAGPRAERTRGALMQAAYDLFTTRGYHDTPVADIATQAGVSLGTFYQYFRDRSDVVASLVRAGVSQMVEQTDIGWRVSGGRDSLVRMLRGFIAQYVQGAAFSKMWEAASHTEPELAELRRDLGRLLTEQVERELTRGGEAGHCRPFNPREAALTARTLTGMVDRFCYVTYVFDPPEPLPTPDESAELLADVWAAAIDLKG